MSYDINLKHQLQKLLEERSITIKEMKEKLKAYQETEMKVKKIFNKGNV